MYGKLLVYVINGLASNLYRIHELPYVAVRKLHYANLTGDRFIIAVASLCPTGVHERNNRQSHSEKQNDYNTHAVLQPRVSNPVHAINYVSEHQKCPTNLVGDRPIM